MKKGLTKIEVDRIYDTQKQKEGRLGDSHTKEFWVEFTKRCEEARAKLN